MQLAVRKDGLVVFRLTFTGRDGVTLHLSEHHGDATPGAKVVYVERFT
ncbi:glyoxalase superfamily protein [Chitinophaga rhizosphaerae]